MVFARPLFFLPPLPRSSPLGPNNTHFRPRNLSAACPACIRYTNYGQRNGVLLRFLSSALTLLSNAIRPRVLNSPRKTDLCNALAYFFYPSFS